jgi:uncharacterized surface protein with fasciclin (FAS1) repeats
MNKVKNRLTAVVTGAAALALTAVAQAPHEQNIVEIALANDDFSVLTDLVVQAGLAEALQAEGPFTVFAPTNEAFDKLPASTLLAVANDRELLQAVLKYHVVPAKVTAADVVNVDSAPTLLQLEDEDPLEIQVEVRDDEVILIHGGGESKVTAVDIMAENGVIHVVDSVLIPPMGGEKAQSTQPAKSSCGW